MSAYCRPNTLDDALALLQSRGDLTIIAGGTDVIAARTSRLAWGNMQVQNILDISALRELRGIEERDTYWWVGALTTWSDIIAAPLPPIFDGLKSAAREIGGVQIQNRGTIAGNCCTASPAGDCIPCLLALDAEFELVGSASRVVRAADFFTGYRQTAVLSTEMVTGVRIPKQSGRSAFRKLGARRYLIISVAMIAGVIDRDEAGRVVAAKFAVGACAPTAQRLPDLEAALIGERLNPALVLPEHFNLLVPIDDIRASGRYRRHVACELTRDIIRGFTVTPLDEPANG